MKSKIELWADKGPMDWLWKWIPRFWIFMFFMIILMTGAIMLFFALLGPEIWDMLKANGLQVIWCGTKGCGPE
jgi:hypothetical protein